MIPASFEYTAPRTLEEALSLLRQHGDDGKIIAGGHSLLPLMKLRLAAPTILIDIGRVPELSGIEDRGDHIALRATTTHHSIASSDVVRAKVPLMAEAAGMVGDMQVRNRGTIGGSLAHADPAADLPAVVVALGAEIVATGSNGQRAIPADQFFVDIWTTALQPDEILTEIRLPVSSDNAQWYEKFRQRAGDWAIVGSAVNVVRENGSIRDARVVLTNVGTVPVRAREVEQALVGQAAAQSTVQSAAERAADGLEPTSELKASADYKRHLAQVLTRRALSRALGLS